jgi:5-methylthioadenosine/S-adenosylhomocysteine deaminase
MEYLFSNVTAVTMDDSQPVLKDSFVLVSQGKIAYIGPDRPAAFSGDEIDGRGKVLLPGLINGHTHLSMSVLRGYADDYDLQTWLFKYIIPIEDRMDARCVRSAALLGIAEAIASGTTSFSDMYNFHEEVLAASEGCGIKANISQGIVLSSDDFDFKTHPTCVALRALHKSWHNRDDGRIKLDAAIHAEYTSNAAAWSAIADYAAGNGLGLHVHLSETKTEHEACIAKYGMTPAQVLDHEGVWKPRAIAAHCVWVSDEDIDLLAERGVSAIHNPVSNLKLASGVAPVPKMIARGLNVALGTDSVASNNNHDMFEEIKAAALIHKGVSGDPLAINAWQSLKFATVNGARAQGRQAECGKVEVGMDADLILVDFDRPHLFPCHNVVSNLVYSARGSDVVLTMVRGKILYRNGEFTTIDMDKVYSELRGYTLPKLFGPSI